MKKIGLVCAVLCMSSTTLAQNSELESLGQAYFAAWQATQMPSASKQDIEHYLTFLAEDVGHQHLPYDNDDSRHATGKADIREGMGFYLGAHDSYASQLKQIVTAHNAVVITYSTQSSGKHPQTQEVINLSFDTMEVLEIEDGKVSVIRKYEE